VTSNHWYKSAFLEGDQRLTRKRHQTALIGEGCVCEGGVELSSLSLLKGRRRLYSSGKRGFSRLDLPGDTFDDNLRNYAS